MNEEEIAGLRKSWELEDHWKLRKAFLEVYCDTLEADKLLCLAQTFVNIETLGVAYSKDVMMEMERLSENVPYLAEYRAIKEKRDGESAERRKNRKEAKSADKKRNAANMPYQDYRFNQRNESSYNKRSRGGGGGYNTGNYQHQSHQPHQSHQSHQSHYQSQYQPNQNPYSQYSRRGGPSSSRYSY